MHFLRWEWLFSGKHSDNRQTIKPIIYDKNSKVMWCEIVTKLRILFQNKETVKISEGGPSIKKDRIRWSAVPRQKLRESLDFCKGEWLSRGWTRNNYWEVWIFIRARRETSLFCKSWG